MTTTSGGLPLMAQTQNSRYLTYNEFAWAVNVLQGGVISRSESAPPGSPAVGDAYIVAATATGAWAGHENDIAFYFGGIWNFLEPEVAQGNGIFVQDESPTRVRWNGSAFVILGAADSSSYTPASPGDWGSPTPDDVAQALDELAAALGDAGAVDSVNSQTGTVSLNGGHIGVKGADIASASTVDLATATGDWVDVTGTTTITAFGTLAAGIERLVRFTGILTLTHHATSLILPTGANITTAAGDFARLRSLGSGNWGCVAYQRANGKALSETAQVQCIPIAVSDETTALTTGAAKVTFRMPYAFTLTDIRASVTTAPTGADLIVDVNEGGTSIMTTNKLRIDATEKTTTTAATPPTLTDTSLADDAEITIDIDQVGSTVAGAGLKVCLIGIKT